MFHVPCCHIWSHRQLRPDRDIAFESSKGATDFALHGAMFIWSTIIHDDIPSCSTPLIKCPKDLITRDLTPRTSAGSVTRTNLSKANFWYFRTKSIKWRSPESRAIPQHAFLPKIEELIFRRDLHYL